MQQGFKEDIGQQEKSAGKKPEIPGRERPGVFISPDPQQKAGVN